MPWDTVPGYLPALKAGRTPTCMNTSEQKMSCCPFREWVENHRHTPSRKAEQGRIFLQVRVQAGQILSHLNFPLRSKMKISLRSKQGAEKGNLQLKSDATWAAQRHFRCSKLGEAVDSVEEPCSHRHEKHQTTYTREGHEKPLMAVQS